MHNLCLLVYIIHVLLVLRHTQSQERFTTLLSLCAAVVLLTETWHFILFYLIYELSIWLLIPVFSIASNSFRKTYALSTMYIVLILSAFSFFGLLSLDLFSHTNHSSFDYSSHSYMHFFLSIIILSNVPSYPLYFWLPEAHVEATWLGSIILACIILNFSLYCCLMFAHWSSFVLLSLNVVFLSLLSCSMVIVSIACSSDLNKVGAFLSVFHMNLGMFLLLSSSSTYTLANDTLWAAHSVLALLYFWWLGTLYSYSGSRLLTMACSSPLSSPLNWLASLVLLILNLGLPLGPLYLPELLILSNVSYLSVACVCLLFFLLAFSSVLLCSMLLSCWLYYDVHRNTYDLVFSSCLVLSPLVCYYIFLWPD